jgi:hypothetical protein
MANGALERNAQSFIERTTAARIGLGDKQRGNVSIIKQASETSS